jgi:hypothetical protein
MYLWLRDRQHCILDDKSGSGEEIPVETPERES